MTTSCTTEKSKPIRIFLGYINTRSLSVLGSLALVACASVSTNSPADLVRLRGNERWAHLVAGDFTKSYNYTTAGFRAVVPLETYRGRTGSAVKWLVGEVIDVTCPEAEKCVARIRLDYKPLKGGRPTDKYSTQFDETWLLESGQWSILESIKGN